MLNFFTNLYANINSAWLEKEVKAIRESFEFFHKLFVIVDRKWVYMGTRFYCSFCYSQTYITLPRTFLYEDVFDFIKSSDIWNLLKKGISIQLEKKFCIQFSSVQFSCVWLFATPWTTAHRPPCPSPTPGVHPNPCPLSRWCHPTISTSVVPFSSCPQSFPASGSFPVSQLFASGGQSIGVSAWTSVLPMNTQDWFPLGWTGWISLQSKGLSRVFSNTTVQKHQFFCAQLSL